MRKTQITSSDIIMSYRIVAFFPRQQKRVSFNGFYIYRCFEKSKLLPSREITPFFRRDLLFPPQAQTYAQPHAQPQPHARPQPNTRFPIPPSTTIPTKHPFFIYSHQPQLTTLSPLRPFILININ